MRLFYPSLSNRTTACLAFYAALFMSGLALFHIGEVFFDNEAGPSPILYGRHVLASLGVLIVSGSIIAAVVHWLARQGADKFSLAIFVAASIVSLHYIHISRNEIYTNDWYGHFYYTRFISTHWLNPYGYRGNQDHHPPVYYYFAALVMFLVSLLHSIPVLTALRFFSWMFFLVYNGFGLLTLRRAGLSEEIYKVCVALFLLWPAGLHLASTINSQTCCYAFYAGAFYYALLWYQEGKPKQLVAALWFTGIAFMVRGNALVLFGLIWLFKRMAQRRENRHASALSRRQRASVRKILAVSFLAQFGTFINLSTPYTSKYGFTIPHGAAHFLFFNYDYLLAHPFNDWSVNQSFWDYLFKTFIFGEYGWTSSPSFALWLDVLLYAIVLYTLLPLLIATAREWKSMGPFAAGLLFPMAFLLAFTVVNASLPNQDARLIYPCVVCFVALFGHSHTLLKSRDAALPVFLGPWLAYGFAVLSAVYFWCETSTNQIVLFDGKAHVITNKPGQSTVIMLYPGSM